MRRILKFVKRKWADYAFRKTVQFELEHPIVSFTFDDAPTSAFENGAAILEKYGYTGTFYLSLSMLKSKNVRERFTAAQIKAAYHQGHELGCHTYGHIDFSVASTEQGVRDLHKNQEEMQKLLPHYDFSSFSYPFGAQTKEIKEHVSARYSSARGIGAGIHFNKLDLYNLKTIKLYEDIMPLEQVSEHISQAIAGNGWLIFYTHDVTEDYSAYGCSPQYFEAAVRECAVRQVPVMTVNEAIHCIKSCKI